jgi:hypothetical protein
VLLDAERTGPLLKNIEEPLAAYAAKAVAVRPHELAAKMHVDGIPVIEIFDDGRVGLGIRGFEPGHALVRENDAPSKRIIRPIAFVNFDFHVRQGLLQKNGAVKTRWAATDANDTFHRCTIDPDTLDVK